MFLIKKLDNIAFVFRGTSGAF